jgi:hypothetical protein
MASPDALKEIAKLEPFQKHLIGEIMQLSAEIRGFTEVSAIRAALRDAALLDLTKEQTDYLKMRLLVYAESGKHHI